MHNWTAGQQQKGGQELRQLICGRPVYRKVEHQGFDFWTSSGLLGSVECRNAGNAKRGQSKGDGVMD